jgi:RNA polymerase sigma factor (sigma-70 family)
MKDDTEADSISDGLLSVHGEVGVRKLNQEFVSYRTELRKFVARQLNNKQEADDVVQDIYQELLRWPARHAIHNPRAWLWRIAWRVLNEARNRHRKLRAHIAVDPTVIEAWASRNGFQASASAEAPLEATEELLAALAALPAPTQIAFVRSRRDGWTHEAIAQELGVGRHMVEKHITRALAHFTKLSMERSAARKESRR